MPPPATPAAWMTPSIRPKRARRLVHDSTHAATSARQPRTPAPRRQGAPVSRRPGCADSVGSSAVDADTDAGPLRRGPAAPAVPVRMSRALTLRARYSARTRPTPPIPPVMRYTPPHAAASLSAGHRFERTGPNVKTHRRPRRYATAGSRDRRSTSATSTSTWSSPSAGVSSMARSTVLARDVRELLRHDTAGPEHRRLLRHERLIVPSPHERRR